MKRLILKFDKVGDRTEDGAVIDARIRAVLNKNVPSPR